MALMNMRLILIPAILVSTAVCCDTTLAQLTGGNSGTGGTGANGSTGMSGQTTTTTGFASQLLTGQTTTTTGSTGTGGSTGTTAGNGTTGATAAETGPTGFIGANATDTFIGGAREATDQQMADRQFQAFLQEAIAPSNQSQQTGTPRAIRTTMKINFGFPTASAAQQSGKLANANSLSLLRYISTRPELSGVNVSLASDGTAVLTGLAPSTESARLAANLIRQQPGVRRLNNQIAVAR